MTDNPEKYSMLSEIEKFPNIFILKSMTKMYAIAGLRLGYGISSNKNLIMKVSESGQPWSVNTIASEIGIAMLEDNEYREKFRKLIFSGKSNIPNINSQNRDIFCSICTNNDNCNYNQQEYTSP
jgi:threonine-phosphate decarboxylase